MGVDPFWSKVRQSGECWLWTGAKNPNGYGNVRFGGRMCKAHRVAYELMRGPIPEGLVIDHLCRTPACVNPDHLDPVPHRVNVQRGDTGGGGRWQKSKTHCPAGHAYDEGNTHLVITETGGQRRYCRACRRKRAREAARLKRRQPTPLRAAV